MEKKRAKEDVQKVGKRTTVGIPRSSPTRVLIHRSTACVWQSGRDAQFSAACGRTWSFTFYFMYHIPLASTSELAKRCKLLLQKPMRRGGERELIEPSPTPALSAFLYNYLCTQRSDSEVNSDESDYWYRFVWEFSGPLMLAVSTAATSRTNELRAQNAPEKSMSYLFIAERVSKDRC